MIPRYPLCAPSTDDHPGSRRSSLFTHVLPSIVLCTSLSLSRWPWATYPTLSPLSTHSSIGILPLVRPPAIHATTLNPLSSPLLAFFWFMVSKEEESDFVVPWLYIQSHDPTCPFFAFSYLSRGVSFSIFNFSFFAFLCTNDFLGGSLSWWIDVLLELLS